MTNRVRATIALVLSLSVAGCATHAAIGAPPRTARPQVIDDPAVVGRYVAKLPIGSTVKVRLTSGEKFTAVLMVVDPSSIVVKEKTRIPEAARTVPIDTVVSIEPAGSGMSAGKAILIGAAAGAAAFFGILFLAIANSD